MATEHTGAMVALIPTREDAERIAVAGGEDVDGLHVTLFYLGDAAGYDETARAAIVDRLRALVDDVLRPDHDLPVAADAFAVDVFNPGGDNTCVVLGLTGDDLHTVWNLAADTLDELETSRGGFVLPEQHSPWIPHITIAYTDDPAALVGEVLDRTGPITLDRLRVAFAGSLVDIPLAAPQPGKEAMVGPSWSGERDLTKPAKRRRKDFDPYQARDPRTGEWIDTTPLDMDGFDLISRIGGTFGDLEMGVDPVGDVRLAWRDATGHNLAMDLGADDVQELSSVLGRLAEERDQMDVDFPTHEVVDEEWFGHSQEHKVELYGSGVITLAFAAEEDDPARLDLDPPDDEDGTDDVQAVLDGLDDVLTETAAALQGVKRFDPRQPRDPLTGEWIDTTPGSGLGDLLHRLASAVTKQDALDAAPAKLKRAPRGHSGDYTGEGLSGPHGMGSVRALSEYEGVEYVETNSDLRARDLSDPAVAHRVAEIDKTMSVSRLSSDIRVDRIIQKGAAVFGTDVWHPKEMSDPDFDVQDAAYERWVAGERPNLTGVRWTERGYSSTTADPKVAESFGGRWRQTNSTTDGEPVIMTIFVPKGTGAVQLAEMGHAAEILLQRDLDMEVIADHGVDPDGYRRIDVAARPA
ncbi:ADP-ribosyltransferase [Dactylosporangium sp. NPDC000555]|uniref:ADP-ribosyltransferase n=1 Tax=Dactylosporangium sp. NPDC000555 TaxID=3154260 RepID=UPI003316D239